MQLLKADLLGYGPSLSPLMYALNPFFISSVASADHLQRPWKKLLKFSIKHHKFGTLEKLWNSIAPCDIHTQGMTGSQWGILEKETEKINLV